MDKTRIALRVEVNLDPVAGTFDNGGDFEEAIQHYLDNMIPWYHPKVTFEHIVHQARPYSEQLADFAAEIIADGAHKGENK